MKIPKPKRSQIRMFETIAVLIVFFFLVGFGMIFYTRIKQTTSRADLEQANVLRSIQIAKQISSLPEMSCSSDIVTEIQNCVDIHKIEAIESLDIFNTNTQYYFPIFGNSRIIVTKLYPDEETTTIYNNPKPQQNYKGEISAFLPIVLFNPKTNQKCAPSVIGTCSFGILNITIYT